MQLRLLLVIIFIQFSSLLSQAQFLGGPDDGSSFSLVNARPLGNSFFKGGTDDGFSFFLLSNQNLGNSFFRGGADDGFSFSLLTNQTLGNSFFRGGADDGFSFSLQSNQNLGNSFFRGGADDGISFSQSNSLALGTSFYRGGADDGWAMAVGLDLQLVPVTLLSFTAAWRGADVLTNWQTSMEMNLHHFEVQRSINGSSFSTVGQVAATGNSNTIRNYQFTDSAVNNNYSSAPPRLFYRLKSVDNDGSFQYSAIVVLNNSQEKTTLYSLYPNPADQQLVVETKGSFKKYSLRLISPTGQVLIQKEVNAQKEIVHTGRYPSGTYTIQIIDAEKQTTEAFKILIVH